jgi:hypothetical protein
VYFIAMALVTAPSALNIFSWIHVDMFCLPDSRGHRSLRQTRLLPRAIQIALRDVEVCRFTIWTSGVLQSLLLDGCRIAPSTFGRLGSYYG